MLLGRNRNRNQPRTTNPLAMSMRSLILLKEFSTGETLGCDPDTTRVEFPDEDPSGKVTAGKYKRFVIHFSPPDGLYSGGTYSIEFDVRGVPEYPNKPPKARMLTKIWHPNIDQNGAICHNYLKVDDKAFGEGAGWTPVLKMEGLCQGILSMFYEDGESFNPEDPLNVDAAKMYAADQDAFRKKAREWVKQYASSFGKKY